MSEQLEARVEELDRRVTQLEETIGVLTQEPADEDPTGFQRFARRARARREAER